MTMEQYINENRTKLLQQMKELCPNNPHTDDDEIEMWILNDAGLYFEAQAAGVDECQD